MSKLDEIRNRLKKDAEGGSILDKYSESKKTNNLYQINISL